MDAIRSSAWSDSIGDPWSIVSYPVSWCINDDGANDCCGGGGWMKALNGWNGWGGKLG
jgi:hypothetical protein